MQAMADGPIKSISSNIVMDRLVKLIAASLRQFDA